MRSPFERKAPVPPAVPLDPTDCGRDVQAASSGVTMTANKPLAIILIRRSVLRFCRPTPANQPPKDDVNLNQAFLLKIELNRAVTFALLGGNLAPMQ